MLTDKFGRVHTDLRISVTDRCNIRCWYCMPDSGAQFASARDLLSFEEIGRFVSAALALGVRKVRLTGGEPLLRPGLPKLVETLSAMRPIEDLALTTNGVLLAKAAADLFAAGLRRLNVHVDTLNRERFRALTRRDELPRVLEGLAAARDAGFRSIKINAVAAKGHSEDDIGELIDFGRTNGYAVRFIEFMPLDAQGVWNLQRVLTARDILQMVKDRYGSIRAVHGADENAPATEYELADGYRFGVIASVSRPFCMQCNRLRLTADGHLRNCLFAHDETNVKPLLAEGSAPGHIQEAIRRSVESKWIGHEIQQVQFIAPARPMYAIGG